SAQPDQEATAGDAAAAARPAAAAPSPAAVAHDAEGSEPLDALFAPEPPAPAPRRRRGRGCLITLVVLLVIGGVAAGAGVWIYNTYQTQIDDIMGWGEPKDYEAGIATGEAFVTIKKGDTGGPVSTALFEAKVTKTDRVFYEYLIENEP